MKRELEGISSAVGDYPQLASRGKRLGGALLDGLIQAPIGVAMLLSGWLEFDTDPTLAKSIAWATFGLAVFLSLHGYLLHKRGQTIGKYLVKTRIVLLTGETPSLARTAGLRYAVPSFMYAVPFAGSLFAVADILFIFGRERRCLHDYLAGTRVIDSEADMFDK